MSEPKRRFKGVWIPKELWESQDLTWFQILFLAEIDSLSDEKDGCTAQNDWLSNRFKSTPQGVSQMISKLAKAGWLVVKMDAGTRRIWFKFPHQTLSLASESDSPASEASSPASEQTPSLHIYDKSTNREKGTSDPFRDHFIKLWSENFKEQFGFDYHFSGGKDGTAVKTLSKMGMTADEALAVAMKAWGHPRQFISSVSQTISGFASQIVSIRLAVQKQASEIPDYARIPD